MKESNRSSNSSRKQTREALRDQVTYLGHDLNPGAVGTLKPEADQLNAQAKELYSAIDKTTAAATNNISQLRSD